MIDLLKSIPPEWFTAVLFILAGIVSVCWIFDWKPFTFAGKIKASDLFKIPDTGAAPDVLKRKTKSSTRIKFPAQTSGIPGSVYRRRHHDHHRRKRHTRKRRVAP